MKTLINNFQLSAANHPANHALYVDGAHYTYAELNRYASEIANCLAENLNSDAPPQCAIYAWRSYTAYAAVLGAGIVGMAYVPLNPQFPDERNIRVVDLSLASALIVDGKNAEKAASMVSSIQRPLTIIFPDLEMLPAWTKELKTHRFLLLHEDKQSNIAEVARQFNSQNAYILFTSGTTGLPKGVAISHENAVAYIQSVYDRYLPKPVDRFTQLFDLTFDLSVHDMFLCWTAGACLYSVPSNHLLIPDRFIREHEITFWFSVPSAAAFLKQFGRLKPSAFPSLKWSLFCGEALPTTLAADWQKSAPNSTVENLYGPTEATIAFTVYQYKSDENANNLPTVPIGTPLPNQKVAIANEQMKFVAKGEAGELLLAGTQLACGYWNNTEITAEKFVELADEHSSVTTRWYKTGDLVKQDKSGCLMYLGRIDNQIKIRGYRVEIQEIEFQIRRASGTDLIAVIPWPVDPDGQVRGVIAYGCGFKTNKEKILSYCREHLPEYMVPGEIHALETIPLNSNGKTDYKKLKEMRVLMDKHSNPKAEPSTAAA
ncbi:MAG: amino acid adenylation domain-containing protein [Burkholderiales bacterium]|nr:amino acid adenylation domain-containing protein [Burkholderiales bacterium]